VPDRLPNNYYRGVSNYCLNRDIVDNKEDCEAKEKLTKVGIISSHNLQYSKKVVDFYLP